MGYEGYFSIIDYAVDGPTTQRELIDAFAAIQRRSVRFYPGYRGARIFASTDGRRIYNLVEWASQAHFEEFEQTADTAGRAAAIQSAIEGVSGTATAQMTGPPRFTLACTVQPGPESSQSQ